jgi:hypothetical protein
VRLGVVVSCYRQDRFLPRTVAALERALEGEDWHGALEFAAPSDLPPPALGARWRIVPSFDPATGAPRRRLTPGAGRMAGFAACDGEWVLFVDSDVDVEPAWVRAALAAAAREPNLAGLGGRLEEWFEDGAATRPGKPDMYGAGSTDHPVQFLAALSFYRAAALRASGGYDERLESDEDFELGLRLTALGLELRSLGVLAGRHWSAPRPSFRELSRRWSTGICFGQGEVLRLYLGRRGFGALFARQRLYVATLLAWLLGVAALGLALAARDPRPLALWALVPLAGLGLMAARKRSVRLAAYSLLTWSLQAFGLAIGLFRLPADAAPIRPREAAC